MGTKRIGLARVQALIEDLKREVQLNQTTLVGSLQKTISLTGAGATKTLTADDNGALVILGGSNASEVMLPPVLDGLRFTFYATTAFDHVVGAQTAVIQGVVYDNNDEPAGDAGSPARTAVADKSDITLVNPAIGDSLEFYSDGTNWYVKGWTNDTPSLGI